MEQALKDQVPKVPEPYLSITLVTYGTVTASA